MTIRPFPPPLSAVVFVFAFPPRPALSDPYLELVLFGNAQVVASAPFSPTVAVINEPRVASR